MLKKLFLFMTLIMLVTSSAVSGVEVIRYHSSRVVDSLVPVPEEALEEDIREPDHVIGTGTSESCTAEAFIEAVAKGGIIVFNGGSEPFTITLDEPAKVFNDQNLDVIIDGGGLVTLSGGDKSRILYMNTCDPDQSWTSSHCQNQDHPRLTVQNLTFANGNSENESEYTGGGAIWVRGGRFKVVNCVFINNRCESEGPDVGGGAIRVFSQYEGRPVYVVNSVFGGKEGLGNVGSNGGAISSIGVSWSIYNSVFSHNEAVGNGGNPAKSGTPGGGSGGAVYNDGNEMTLELSGCTIEHNKVNAYGSGIFFVTNNHTGIVKLHNTIIEDNEGGSWYPVIPDLSMHKDTTLEITTYDYGDDVYEKPIVANPTQSPVLVDGVTQDFEAYNIDDNNYFKLRDIAAILNGSDKEFEILWDDKSQSIEIVLNKSYTRVGGELETGEDEVQICQKSSPNLTMKGEAVTLTTYLVHGNNFVKLRDIGELVDFGVEWDGVNEVIHIESDEGYQH